MPMTLLDLHDQFVTQVRLDVEDLPGAVILGDRIFFRWQASTYRETAVHRIPVPDLERAAEKGLLVNTK